MNSYNSVLNTKKDNVLWFNAKCKDMHVTRNHIIAISCLCFQTAP